MSPMNRHWAARIVILIGGLAYAIASIGIVVNASCEPARDALGLATLVAIILSTRMVCRRFREAEL